MTTLAIEIIIENRRKRTRELIASARRRQKQMADEADARRRTFVAAARRRRVAEQQRIQGLIASARRKARLRAGRPPQARPRNVRPNYNEFVAEGRVVPVEEKEVNWGRDGF